MSSLCFKPGRRRGGRARERGVVLVIALIVLVAMTLAGIALVRSVDTATLIAGNLAFRQSTVLYSDKGIGAAVNWLRKNSGATLDSNQTPFYFATWSGGLPAGSNVFDATKFSWASNASPPITDVNGYQAVYVIHRMCVATGPVTVVGNCIAGPGSTASPNALIGQDMCPNPPCKGGPVALYRITTRAVGPRNAVSYTQAVVY